MEKPKNREEAIDAVSDGITWLIYNHMCAAAVEQYRPSMHADASDNEIQEHKKWVENLQKLRSEFESLVTGML